MTRLSFSSTASLYHAPLRPAWLSSPLPREHLGPFQSAFSCIGDLGTEQKLFPNSSFLQIAPSLLGYAPGTGCMAWVVLMLRRIDAERGNRGRERLPCLPGGLTVSVAEPGINIPRSCLYTLPKASSASITISQHSQKAAGTPQLTGNLAFAREKHP